MVRTDANSAGHRRARPFRLREQVAWGALAFGVALSAVVVKEAGSVPSMVQVETRESGTKPVVLATRFQEPLPEAAAAVSQSSEPPPAPRQPDIRWFDGRPIRPVKTVWMTVTAYSPDRQSCGEYADGKTATLHSVWTNGMELVAADPKVLPYGSMITVPGYARNDVVPVLDCGGAIKGHRLDVLYATHAQARQWGVKKLPVTIWEYADGKPAPNPREVR